MYRSQAIVMVFAKKLVLLIAGVAIAGLFTLLPLPGDDYLAKESFSFSVEGIEAYFPRQLPRKNYSTSQVYPPMKITFRQSGGYAGLTMGCEIDTDSLPADEAANLQSLVKESGILQAKSERTPNARDLLIYQLTIETNNDIHQVSFDDISLPEKALPLVEYLQNRVKPVQ